MAAGMIPTDELQFLIDHISFILVAINAILLYFKLLVNKQILDLTNILQPSSTVVLCRSYTTNYASPKSLANIF